MSKLSAVCVAFVLAFFASANAEELVLAGKGFAPAAISTGGSSSPVIRHAAEELALYLGKITATPAPEVSSEIPSGTRCPILLMTADRALEQKILPEQEIGKLKEDGFILHVSDGKLFIIGSNPLGTLYGSYEVVKKYGGIRFLAPGSDGEYFTVKNRIAIPEGTSTSNPAFPFRTVFLGRSSNNYFMKDTWDWEVRNNLRVRTTSIRFRQEAKDYLAKVDGYCSHGGHVFSELLASPRYNADCTMKELFAAHPDIFPLINGKRTMLTGQKYQPCTSNPKTLERMRRGVINYVEKRMKPGDLLLIGNNDGTSWCQCENCRKLDPPAERAAGSVATRYWLLVNDLARTVWEKHPEMRLAGWAYQNFHQVPKGVVPDPRLHVVLAWNNVCFRHDFADPKCPVNRDFLKKLGEWRKLGNPLVVWEETTHAAADCYLPIERNFLKTLKTYRELGVSGPLLLASAPEATYSPYYKKTLTPISWYAMWNFMYLSARFLWDGDLDYEKEFREANLLYYGAAGETMIQYHRLIEKAMFDLPICFAMGNTPVGRCLEQPGMEAAALRILEHAKKKAADDPRALKHIACDERFFREVWMRERKNYLSGFRELKTLLRQMKIIVDGKDTEADWKKAERVSQFKKMRRSLQDPIEDAAVQTVFRVVYEPDFLYFYIEALEPRMGEIKAEYTDRDSALWNDNSIEIFINHPNIGNRYFHYIFNHNGAVYDAFCDGLTRGGDKSFQSMLRHKIVKNDDRWCIELVIPAAELGFKCFPGSRWKINVARARVLKDGTVEHSSVANGFFHNVNNFLPLVFTKKSAQNGKEVDVSPWKNGSFETIVPYGKGKRKEWNVKDGRGPLNWSLLSRSGAMEVCRDSDRNSNYLKLSGGSIYQFYQGKAQSFQLRFKVAGKGTLNVRLLRQKPLPDGKRTGLPTKQLQRIEADSPEWKEYAISCKLDSPDEFFAPVFDCVAGSILLDDVMVIPEERESRSAE